MTTLQEQFEKDFPDKSVSVIMFKRRYKDSNFTNYDLDLRGYKELNGIECSNSKLTSIDLTGLKLINFNCSYNNLTSLNLTGLDKLIRLDCCGNNLTSVDFLNTLPNPEKLANLRMNNNNIQPTDIAIFSKFVRLGKLFIGTDFRKGSTHEFDIDENFYNRFYGSLKSLENLINLRELCIANTDVNEGLEYLPRNFLKSIKTGIYFSLSNYSDWQKQNLGHFLVFDCQAQNPNAKCSAIQDQLRPFNYDLQAWQLANPEKMLISKPELFTNPDSKDKWLQALTDKITSTQQELQQVKEKETDKLSKIARLEIKIKELEKTKSTLTQQTQTEFQTQDKSTQTDLTGEQIKELEENKQTLYQKYTEKYGK